MTSYAVLDCGGVWLHLRWHKFTRKGSFPGITQYPLDEAAGTSLEPKNFLIDFLFLIIFLHRFLEAISVLRILHMLNTNVNSLGKISPLDFYYASCRLFWFCRANICGALPCMWFLFFFCLEYHPSYRSTCLRPKEQLWGFNSTPQVPSFFPECSPFW